MPTPNITRLMRVSFASLFGLLAFAVAQELAYTVQVVALSDRAAAGALQRELLAEGYPVYLVGVPTDEGTVYRLRVGAFGDRGAALAYAEAMRRGGTGAGTGAPVPALAEDVPAGLIPLEPTLLTSYPYLPGVTRLTVVPWGEGYALRFQGAFEGEPLEAEYRVLEGGATPFRAWRAAPFGEGAIERVYNFPLWPPDWEALEASGRDAYEESVLATLASSYGLSVDTLRDYRALQPGSGLPYLVRAERRDLATGEGRYYPALGLPQATRDPAGPALRWFDGEAEGFLRGLPEPVFDAGLVLGENAGGPGAALPPPETLVSGGGWTASPDDAYTRVRLGPTGRNWRAVAGYPLWAHEDFLLVFEAGQVQLYRFSERAE